MANNRFGRWRASAPILALGAALLAGGHGAHAQLAVGPAAESPADALARNMKTLGSSPRNFDALIGAGRAALALADTQAAAGFFGRAEEAWPASPLPQAGMGAAMAQEGDGATALRFFARAVQLGATQSMIGADRGLAYDLLGQHTKAQADYRAALLGRDRDEARRRLALSLAITGNKAEALSMLSPLMARGDAAGARVRAFVLALSGDVSGARSAIDAAMPGSGSSMDYFFRKLPALRSDEKVAACNLGIFPGGAMQVASAEPRPDIRSINPVKVVQVHSPPREERASDSEDRIQSIEQWLSRSRAIAPVQAPAPSQPKLASTSVPQRVTVRPPARGGVPVTSYSSSKIWLQLASGSNASALPDQFNRMRSRNRDLFEGISGYVVEAGGRARLLIGPFRNLGERDIFANDLESARVDAVPWTSQPGQMIRKLPSE